MFSWYECHTNIVYTMIYRKSSFTLTFLYAKSIYTLVMGRKKLIEKYAIDIEKIEASDYYTYLTIFQRYNERFIMQIHNWIERRYGSWNIQLLLLEEQRWWGMKRKLEVKIPRTMKNWAKLEKTIIRYARGIVPDPRVLNMYRVSAENLGDEYDVIIIEIRDMVPPLF